VILFLFLLLLVLLVMWILGFTRHHRNRR